MVTAGAGPCLVCNAPATIADWTPIQEWLSVEGCGCGGFFISKGLWGARLVGMRVAERRWGPHEIAHDLAAVIDAVRLGPRSAGHVDRGEASRRITQEPMRDARGIAEDAHDLTAVIDAVHLGDHGAGRAGHVERGEAPPDPGGTHANR